jgi:hypothetical protein
MATPDKVSEMSRRTRATEPTAPVASAARRSMSLGWTRWATCEFVSATTGSTTRLRDYRAFWTRKSPMASTATQSMVA